ncbi:MAG: DUF4261 domain-containing protein [Rhodobacteraceae bacterium]|nr:DUF4261 domain-containing protein [Paracoccaceae bacterium]
MAEADGDYGAGGDAPERYSDKRLNDSFSVYLLLSEPLQFSMREVAEAITEDYPVLGRLGIDINPIDALDTGDVTVLGVLMPKDVPECEVVTFTSLKGSLDVEYFETALQRLIAPDRREDMTRAVQSHVSYLCITCGSKESDLGSQFLAARMATCIAAVFAKLPICQAVYYPTANMITTPDEWVKGADKAAAPEWPLEIWVSWMFLRDERYGAKEAWIGCHSDGMAAFNGHEVCFRPAPLPLPKVFLYAYTAVYLPLAGGNAFRDGDTVGVEDSDEKIRMRLAVEGREILPHPHGNVAGTDTWVLFHPSAAENDEALFGPRANAPAPEGFDNSLRPEEGFLRRLLGRRKH